MAKCNIQCAALEEARNIRRWEVTPEGRVWPCCYFSTSWDKRNVDDNDFNTKALLNDKRIMDVMKNDPNWNNLEYHSMNEIIEHELFQTYIYYKGWESDNPAELCVRNCSVTKKRP